MSSLPWGTMANQILYMLSENEAICRQLTKTAFKVLLPADFFKGRYEIWYCISTDHQLPTSFTTKNPKVHVAKVTQLMTDSYRTGSTQPIEQSSLRSEEKRDLFDFVKRRLKEKGVHLDLDWKISIVVGNQYVQKSLHPIVELEIEGEKLELDMEGLAQMRLALAKALMSTDKYSNQ